MPTGAAIPSRAARGARSRQNHTFRDHYLELDLDLSDVLFIAHGQRSGDHPGTLLDRTEVIRLDGYTDREKVDIARDHLLPRQSRHVGPTDDRVSRR